MSYPIKLSTRSREDYIKIVALTLGLFASVMSTTILSILSPKIIAHFGIDYETWQTRNILFFALFASSQILMGKIADRFNPHHQLYVGLGLFIASCVGSVLAALSGSWGWFMTFQGIQSICDAGMALAVVTLIRRSFNEDQLGWAFGCFSAVMASGGIAGAGLGGLFNDGLGAGLDWYAAIAFLGIIATFSFVLVWRVVPVNSSLGGGSFAGREWLAVATTLAIAGAIYFAQKLGDFQDWSLTHSIVLAAIAAAALLEWYASRGGISLIPWPLFQNLHFSSAAVRVFLAGIIVNVGLLIFPLAFQQLYGLDAGVIAAIMAAEGVLVVILGPICGRLADRNLILCLIGGLTFTLTSLVVVSGLWLEVNLTVACLYYFLYGLGVSLSSPAQMKLISVAIDEAQVGQGMGFYHFMQFISGVFAAGVIGSMFVGADKTLTVSAWQSALTVCIGLTLLRVAIISFDIAKLRRAAA